MLDRIVFDVLMSGFEDEKAKKQRTSSTKTVCDSSCTVQEIGEISHGSG